MNIKIINTSNHDLPHYETEASAGMDLRANLTAPVTLNPLERTIIKTGLFMELPIGFEAQVRPRSGLAAKKGITVLNAPGTHSISPTEASGSGIEEDVNLASVISIGLTKRINQYSLCLIHRFQFFVIN